MEVTQAAGESGGKTPPAMSRSNMGGGTMTMKERIEKAKAAIMAGAQVIVWTYDWDAERSRFRTDKPEIEATGNIREKVITAIQTCDRVYHDGRLGVQMDGVWYTVEISGIASTALQSNAYRRTARETLDALEQPQ